MITTPSSKNKSPLNGDTAQINEGVSPLTYEMAILGIEGIESGRKGLTSAIPLKVKLKNNGLATVTSLDIKIEVDDLPVVEKTLSVSNSGYQ